MHTELRTLLRQTSALTSIAVFGVLFAQPVLANPLGGDVVSGAATISTPDPTTTLIDQSTDRAIINWNSFDIGAGELTQFDLPSADSWTLNRVVGSRSPSSIQGAIRSNGNIVIVNPDGMHFGPGSTVDVNRLIASTADITNDNFMAGKLDFGIAGNPSASIVNEGVISATDYGLAALVAPSVRNSGVIMARLGTVGLAAGNSFTIDPYGDGLIKLAIGDEIAGEVFDVATGEAVSDLLSNDGTLWSDGGTVAMTAATARQAVNSVVNNTGIVEARSVGMQNGMIVLGGSIAATKPVEAPVQVVRVSGTVDASGSDELYPLGTPITGGEIEITGEVILASSATIDASGTNGGGTILVGGDYLGGNIEAQDALTLGVELEDREIKAASLVVLDEETLINASASKNGDGGKVIIWSDGSTVTAASIIARGGVVAGDGGFVETSGSFIDIRNAADASASNGTAGTWLIDPYDIRIDTTPSGTQEPIFDQTFFVPNDLADLIGDPSFEGFLLYPSSASSVLDVAVIELGLNNGASVVISTVGAPGDGNGDITLATDITKSAGGDALLILDAAGDIEVESGVDITSNSGALWVAFQAFDGAISANNMGELDLNGGGLALIAEDNILLSSNFDMPNLAIEVLPRGGGARAVAIEFDDDEIAFGFNDETVIIPTGGISLTDTSADGTLAIDVDGLDLNMDIIFSNLSLVDRFGRFRFIENDDGSIGVLEPDALDGIPEIVFGVDQYDLFGQNSNGQNYLYTAGPEPDAGIIPVAEISTDFNESVDVYEVGAPSGIAIIEAYLAELNPPVEPPSPPVVQPTEPEQVILDPSVNVPDIFQQYNEPIGPRQLTAQEREQILFDRFRSEFSPIDVQIFRNRVFDDRSIHSVFLIDLLQGLDNSTPVSQMRNVVRNSLEYLADSLGLSIDEVRLLNDGRNSNQQTQPSYKEIARQPGWQLAAPGESIFHAAGLETTDVEKWISTSGAEFVFDTSTIPPELVEGRNVGTFNYGSDPASIEHVILDILPWLYWGTGPTDSSNFSQRLGLFDKSPEISRVKRVVNPLDSLVSDIGRVGSENLGTMPPQLFRN